MFTLIHQTRDDVYEEKGGCSCRHKVRFLQVGARYGEAQIQQCWVYVISAQDLSLSSILLLPSFAKPFLGLAWHLRYLLIEDCCMWD
jgi:hypothetical protein